MNEEITALYSPEKGMVACALLQAAYGFDRRVCHLFDARDWIVAPDPTFVRMTDTLENWRGLAAMSREDRIAAFHNLRGAKVA